MLGHATDTPTTRRVPVEEAAKLLGITANAVRKRIERGTLRSEREGDTRYVLLEADMPKSATGMSSGMPADIALVQAYLDSMRDQVDYLKTVIAARDEEIRRKDHLLAAALERIPAIEASSEPQNSDLSGSEEKNAAAQESDESIQHRSWLYKFFFRL